jgi:hypothetical protein
MKIGFDAVFRNGKRQLNDSIPWNNPRDTTFRTLDLGSEPNIRVYDSTALNAKGKTPNNLRT